MAEATQEQINRYLQDVVSAERNFEAALNSFGNAGEQSAVQMLMLNASAGAKTQHERLEALLQSRGGSPSSGKTALAEFLAFSPLSAQLGQDAADKNTQHLIVTYGAAAAETAMYESLATVAQAGGASDVVALARTLQEEEKDDARQVWAILDESALLAYRKHADDAKEPNEALAAYIEDVIASEKAFELQLRSFQKETADSQIALLYSSHAEETKEQYESLTSELQAIGGSPSILKNVMSHAFALAPKIAQLGHSDNERETQNLMMAFAVENAEVAMYQTLIVAAEAAGNRSLATLARTIQQQESATAEKLWPHIPEAALRSLNT